MMMYLCAVSLELTFAGRHALEPPVIDIFVVGRSAVLKPSTARSATASSAGFLECTAFVARHRFGNRGGDGWRVDRSGD